MIIETERLFLREMNQSDYPALSKILQDSDVMYAYEGAFSDAETQEWLDKQLERYKEHGFGLWAVILKSTGEMIGQCGLTWQNCNDNKVLEIGYLFQKEFWHKGFATEAAIACKEYAFEKLNADEVFSIIRDTNGASQNVAKRNGMTIKGMIIKHFRGIDMPHYLFSVSRGRSCQMIIETERLFLREMNQNDYPALSKILQDPDVMYAYEGAFSDAETQEWLDKQLERYKDGFGLWAVILKATGEMIGQCGFTQQTYKENKILELGYLFQKAFWHKGFATEAATACRDYAFETLKVNEVFSVVRDTNSASQNVAKRMGMTVKDTFMEHMRGVDMNHYLFSVERESVQ